MRGEDLPAAADNTRRVAVINQTLAKRLWPIGDALGRDILVINDRRTVIGVVADVARNGSMKGRRASLPADG